MRIEAFAFVMGGGSSVAGQRGMSGGDRILIECTKRWAAMGAEVVVHTTENGHLFFSRYLTKDAPAPSIVTYSRGTARADRILAIFGFLCRMTLAASDVAKELPRPRPPAVFYSASDYWPDVVAGFLVRAQVSRSRWLAGVYQIAPSPLQADFPYRGAKALRGILLYLMHKLSLILIKRRSDMIWTTNPHDARLLSSWSGLPSKCVIAIKGGVDTSLASRVQDSVPKVYDAVFIGRLHPQKGVMELLEIWKKVLEKRPNARLAIIGDGYLEEDLTRRARQLGIHPFVSFLGFLDGIEKVLVFKSSYIVVHPAIYDSGGMAACEAMVCGLPGVRFDLETLREYYPIGMLRVPLGNNEEFAASVIRLLEDKTLYSKLSQEARSYAETWDWDVRARELHDLVKSLLPDGPASRTSRTSRRAKRRFHGS